jgi:hypothetical protein
MILLPLRLLDGDHFAFDKNANNYPTQVIWELKYYMQKQHDITLLLTNKCYIQL